MNPILLQRSSSLFPAILVSALMLPSAILPTPSLAGEPFELSTEAVANLRLEYVKVEPSPLSRVIKATGTVRLDERHVIEIVPRIAGIIDKDHQPLGAVVAKGDPLFKLESAELATNLTTYVDAEQAMTFAHTALDQEKQLFERRLSSKETLQARELDFQKALAEHTRALQPLKLLHFDEGTIHQYLTNVGAGNYTSLEVTAPEAGEIIEKSIRLGASVEPDEKLYTIANLSELWLDFHVSLRDAAILESGQVVTVESSVARGQQSDGKVIYVAPLADEATRTVLVRATLPNADRAWRPGTPVTVSVTASSEKDADNTMLAVPSSALVDYDGGKAVFVRSGEAAFRVVSVEIGESDGLVTRIVSGLTAGDTVVIVNAAQLKGHLEMTN
ncbi:MAG: efflux RND transporter periplasmic adaptor subunit [Verrucomicrobiales bacterium]|nr:efflux RND transporter periplasmic adaptor subunit [Verrucomicrobiales bacterium]HQW28175.1 efflux RND transporter periplasmic adaptor subunit [Verrucomicrobiales bacterium]